ncbi:MAG: phosphoenolpyruvate synthase, partial [Deltaproteobacteria bacterium]|nr:phosphoenolpyruvate synthase [Deltaproteobacteria bacterium]
MLVFSTKASTLKLLSGQLRSARIAPLVSFTVAEWRQRREAVLASVAGSGFGGGELIVRSSCGQEDAAFSSNAGAFLSIQGVKLAGVGEAIDQVIASYGNAVPTDEVLVQPMLHGVVRAGVAFSHDPNTKAPYRVINWTEGSSTASVTAGLAGRTWQAAALSLRPPPPHLAPVVGLLSELLELFGAPVDCEFAVTRESAGEVLWLLQARPLVLVGPLQSADQQAGKLRLVAEKVERGMRQHPFLMGQRTVYGVMPDWNPAEIIGVRPKALALSLYRELVTDSTWAYQRNNYGYRNLRSHPLMPHFFGLPYIDVRLSFNSFIPADLDDGLAGRLVDHYIDRLLAEPTLHDKVEFDIVFSCYTLDLPERLKRLEEVGFTAPECAAVADAL